MHHKSESPATYLMTNKTDGGNNWISLTFISDKYKMKYPSRNDLTYK